MEIRKSIYVVLAAGSMLLASCSMTRVIPNDQSLLRSNKIEIMNTPSYSGALLSRLGQKESISDLQKYIKQTPNSSVLGINPFINIYNSGNGSGKGWDKFVKKIGQAPVIFDPDLVESSKTNMVNHLQFKGYYNSKIRDSIETQNKKTHVTYFVYPGRRYIIDSILYSIKDTALLKIMLADTCNSLIKRGKILSEDLLEQESARMSLVYRNRGYYGFTKNYFFYKGDTLSHDGLAHLNIAIEDFTRNETPKEAKPHRVYTFGDVYIAPMRNFQRRMRMPKSTDSVEIARRDSMISVIRSQIDTIKYRRINVIGLNKKTGSTLLLRRKVLNRMNMIRPGEKYNVDNVSSTYQRFSSMGLFSSVNVGLTEIDSSKVKTDIKLMANTLQGYKVNLQGSTNSNGLFGISPTLSYYHKNLFRGGELFSVSVMGDFQFKPNSNVHSTELGISTSLSVPNFLLAPDSWFQSKTIPRTEIITAYSYQKRPEYTRNIISASYGYTWTAYGKWFFKANLIQANIVKLYNLDSTFYNKLNDPFLRNSYKDHFDLGVGGNVYFTTDASTNPAHSFFYFRYALDLSGNLISLFDKNFAHNEYGEKLIWHSPYSQYYKMELSGVYTIKLGQNKSHMVAMRLLGGVGRGYGNSSVLPFEKLFWGGGAYDLRGWQPRTLGPGYAQIDTAWRISNQTGDIKLEANVEYRFPMFWILRGALFADAGNIWTFDRGTDSATGEKTDYAGIFRGKDFYKHIALDCGIGLRLDLSFALLRLDLGFKTFDPAASAWKGPGSWFKHNNFEFSFGIGYPF
jgi:outer membrane protein assembly factor BamA